MLCLGTERGLGRKHEHPYDIDDPRLRIPPLERLVPALKSKPKHWMEQATTRTTCYQRTETEDKEFTTYAIVLYILSDRDEGSEPYWM